ncbi:hypothetical protein ACWDCB_12535 [Streptomyces sp. NPDC001178]
MGAAAPAAGAAQQDGADYWAFCWMAPPGSVKVTLAAASCGGAPLEIIKEYIENQKRPD